ncbi:MAG: methyl-accepting chemotaxis protein [Pseudobutyrivibrio sp.]|uniref:methyl-accepting chemotaxis protein n=1 Tax=Pseudobutyrivibrio sp. TaxID=2014367 RepID=UPI0025E2BF8D|nr:methyl-accepting chemotaxis protein [Pseudobutyrivibrio sp.]MBQ8489029.1 methyl-accepting chemotaxis protein [Pseudobutyrivibrio sp.]
MNKKSSIRVRILIPVLLLGVVSIVSNFMALVNLSKVNNNASKIADEYMVAISQLNQIGQASKDIHTLALSHIVATDFETMTSIILKIDTEEHDLDEQMLSYKNLGIGNDSAYEKMVNDYQSFKESIMILLAQSANQKTKDAYATANGAVSDNAKLLSSDISDITSSFQNEANVQRQALSSANKIASITSPIVVVISVIAVIVAVIVVSIYVIRPIIKAESELNDVIDGINRREGDLTKRITVSSNDEIGALSRGINSFIEHLQGIFNVIKTNSTAMDKVVTDVLGSVRTSNNSASDLSALTEELSATMQEVANSAGIINTNTETVRLKVDEMAQKSREINDYSKIMKDHANTMEQTARSNMEETNKKVEQILASLNQAITDSQSVDQVNSLTDDIMSIASQTNLLSLNASIEAARAGEAGKGFAVVADEIGGLAENSRQTAANIQEINSVVVNAVHNLADSANEIVDYMRNSILPEFARFVDDGGKYRDNADYIESVMNDFTEKTDGFKITFDEIAESISSITSAIDEGVQGVSSAAESTQTLVYDMDTITKRMDENQRIASELDDETAIFSKI